MRLIASIRVSGTAVPWSPPRTFLGKSWSGKKQWVHEKDERLCAWQDAIRAVALESCNGDPYTGPVRLETTFVKGTPNEELWGKPWWSDRPKKGEPDACNLLKAAEDAIGTYRLRKGRKMIAVVPLVIANDSQVCEQSNLKVYGKNDEAVIRVYALGEGD